MFFSADILMMRLSNVVSLQRQCCNQICQCGVAITEYAIHQLPVHMAPALLIAAIRAQKHAVASCIVSNWPLPTLRYACLGMIKTRAVKQLMFLVTFMLAINYFNHALP